MYLFSDALFSFFLSNLLCTIRNLIMHENQCANFFNCFLLVAIPEEIIKLFLSSMF